MTTPTLQAKVSKLNTLVKQLDANHTEFIIDAKRNGFRLGLKKPKSKQLLYPFGDERYSTVGEFDKHLDTVKDSFAVYQILFT